MAPAITLRPWTLDDLDLLVRFANNRKIADNLTDAFPHPYTREDGISFITRFGAFDPPRAFAIVVDGVPCGAISVFPLEDIRRHNAEMGYWLAEPYWGRGIVTEAVRQMIDYGFRTFDITRIFARPFGTNIASCRVLEKAGMRLEARFEKTAIKNGMLVDELWYAIRRPG